jgi:hypothetical protein
LPFAKWTQRTRKNKQVRVIQWWNLTV